MQYGMELISYKRSRKVNDKKKQINYDPYVAAAFYFAISFLVSRVILINDSAPFGIALLISVVMTKEDNMPIVAGCGALLGYITIFNSLDSLPVYILEVGTLVFGAYFVRNIRKRNRLVILFITLLVENVGYSYLIRGYSDSVNTFSSIFDVIIILPIYYMIQYSLLCAKDIRTKHLFSNEEVICMLMIASLAISGTWGVNLWGISIRNIVAFSFVVVCAYVSGGSTGAAAGVAVGLIVGMTTDNIIAYISGLALCGLTVGVFKDAGKWLSTLSFFVAFLILKLYSNIGDDFKLIEVLIAGAVTFGIPEKFYDSLMLEFNWERKATGVNENYTEIIKDMFVEKLRSFSEILFSMSATIKDLVNNDKLMLKSKSSAMVENLAERVCSSCSMNSMCWRKDIYYTYSAFSELIQNFHENNNKLPEELERKCLRKTALVSNTEEIINKFITNELWRSRLVEGRQLVAGHLNNMGDTVKEIVDDFNSSITINNELEKHIKRALTKKGINYGNILCFRGKNQRINVKITLEECMTNEFCVKMILPIVNQAAGLSMCLSEEQCKFENRTGECCINFEEMPKYHIASYVIRECKDGEKFNGDSYSYKKLKDGTYMIIISDGMGSGPEAGQESKAAVELIERFSEAGFSKSTAVNTVNSIMTMKFSEEEKFSTLDITSIDLYNGDMNLMKVGAVATYIKRKEKVEVVKSKTLPIGVLDKVDVDVVNKKVKNGDMIIMLSDGVLECEGNSSSMEEWIYNYLQQCNEANTKEIAESIIGRAKEISNGRTKDDMTVVVSKIYDLY